MPAKCRKPAERNVDFFIDGYSEPRSIRKLERPPVKHGAIEAPLRAVAHPHLDEHDCAAVPGDSSEAFRIAIEAAMERLAMTLSPSPEGLVRNR